MISKSLFSGMRYILGSSSPFRRQAFAKVMADFETLSPSIDERAIRDENPYRLTLKLANAKADALLQRVQGPAVLVTGDQVVWFQGRILEKPESPDQAREFLRGYQNGYVEVINGTVVTNTQTGKRAEANDVIQVELGEIPEDVIEQLIREGDALLCAGALKVEHPALQPSVKKRTGTDDSLMGVPTELVKKLIAEATC